MSAFRWFFALFVFAIYIFGCTQGSNSGSIDLGKNFTGSSAGTSTGGGSNGGGGSSGGGTSSVAEDKNVFTVEVSTVWEPNVAACSFNNSPLLGDAASNPQMEGCDKVSILQAKCEIPKDTPVLNAGQSVSKSCRIKIPEIQLYYSALRFDIKVAEGKCPIVTFSPYYYLASISNGFAPRWGSQGMTYDCSAANTNPNSAPKECFSGPATKLITSFPLYTSLYGVFGNQKGRWGHITPVANTENPRLSNRYLSNYMEASYRNCSNGPLAFSSVFGGPVDDGWRCDSGAGVGSTFRDYSVQCTDEWGLDKWVAEILIEDVDDSGLAYTVGYTPLTANQKASWPH